MTCKTINSDSLGIWTRKTEKMYLTKPVTGIKKTLWRWTNRLLQNETGIAHHHLQHPAILVCAQVLPQLPGPRLNPGNHLLPQWSDSVPLWFLCQYPGRNHHLLPRPCPGWNTAFRQYRCGTLLYNSNQESCTLTITSKPTCTKNTDISGDL